MMLTEETKTIISAKSIKQTHRANKEQLQLMHIFKDMVNHCIRIGLENNCSSMKRLSMLSYHRLGQYPIQSKYKLTAISQACGRLAQMKTDNRKGRKVASPFVTKPYLVSCYDFKINGMVLSFPVKNREFVNILLTDHIISELSKEGIKPRSFTITPTSLSISVQKQVIGIIPQGAVGIDRNLRNVTIATPEETIMYRTEKILSIKQNSKHARSAFRRNDRRVKDKFFARHRGRQTRRVNQYLHKISKHIVEEAKKTNSIIVFENLEGIRKLYKKGNGQGKKFRGKMNGWPFYELQRQVTYKAHWEGIPVKKVDPKRTSKLCPVCGHGVQEDRLNRRKLWCSNCKRIMDRDIVAAMNISYKVWPRFSHTGGFPYEAVKGNPVPDSYLRPVILRVDGSRLVSSGSR